ncbi:MAG: SRPBCC domain-containing protein [Beijerinckiaceae bacterium]|nr:SRPBCC domain-containing protein [Beijerinckiaceae bacterium]MCI0734671.1 SRPBCC domain-containing protein [Beijerinckiaceae bacterium]
MTAATAAKKAEDLVVIITRMFDAPRELVFQAFTDPVHIPRFWGPDGFKSTVREMDVRPGGAFRIDMHAPDGATYPCEGIYREVVAPERIVYAGGTDCGHPCGGGLPPGALITITFADHGGKTKLTIDTRFESYAGREAAVEMGFNAGWAQTLDRLAANLPGL